MSTSDAVISATPAAVASTPPSSASTPVPFLFNDGVLLVLSFLTTDDWIATASTSRHWFKLAAQSTYEITLTRGNLVQKKKRINHIESDVSINVENEQLRKTTRIYSQSNRSFRVVKHKVPSPRLVGIELNPGPLTTTASTLFNDGLRTIFSYLNDHEWLFNVARVSRHWCSLASHTPLKQRSLSHRIGWMRDWSTWRQKVRRHFVSLLCCKCARDFFLQQRWSLSTHVTTLTIEDCDMERADEFNRVTTSFANLLTLDIQSLLVSMQQERNQVEAKLKPPPPWFSKTVPLIILPPHLTSLNCRRIQGESLPDIHASRAIDLFLRSIAAVGLRLTNLHLYIPEGASSQCDWTILSTSLKQLESLTLNIILARVNDTIQPVVEMIQTISNNSMTTPLHSLTIDLLSLSPSSHHNAEAQNPFSLLKLPHLRQLVITGFDMRPEILSQIALNMPRMEVAHVRCDIVGVMKMHQAAPFSSLSSPSSSPYLFSSIRSYTLDGHSPFASRQLSSEDENVLAAALTHGFNPSCFSTLTTEFNLSFSVWDRLCAQYPHLTHVTLSSTFNRQDQLTSFTYSSIREQLTSLELRIPSDLDLQTYVKMVGKCTNLEILKIVKSERQHDQEEQHHFIDSIYNQINSPDYLPRLESLKIHQPAMLEVEWSSRRCWNRFAYSPNSQKSGRDEKDVIWSVRMMTREQRMSMAEQNPVSSPSPRLIGIELNPGPTTAATLSDDGTFLISDFSDMNAAACV